MTAILSLLVILTLSFLITRLASVAFALTGVSYPLAKLQAVSAFTGVGFTTSESEHIVDHPVRRRILIALMILGNAGIITAISSLVISVVSVREAERTLVMILVLVLGPILLWFVATSESVERHLSAAMRWALSRWPRLESLDYLSLLRLTGDFSVREIHVREGEWLEGKRLEECDLFQEGVLVLGIHRAGGEYVGAPRGGTRLRPHDRLVLYGRDEHLAELQDRVGGAEGDAAHVAAVDQQRRTRWEQEEKERREERASDGES